MRSLLFAVVLLALAPPGTATAAAASASPACAPTGGERVVARSVEAVVVRVAASRPRFVACVVASGARRGVPRGFARIGRLAGPYVVHAGRDGSEPALRLFDVATGESTVLEGVGVRIGEVVLDARGRVAWRAGADRLRALEPARTPRTVARGPSISGVRLRRGVLRWRQAGVARRRRLTDATCTPRGGARAVLTRPTVVVSQRTFRTTYPGDPEESSSVTPVWTCLVADGRRRLIGVGTSDFGSFSDLTAFTNAGSLLAYESRAYSKGQGSTDAVVVRDLRSQATVGALGALYDGVISLKGFDALGRTLAVTRTTRIGDLEEVVALSSAGERMVLDPAASGAITEAALAADGTATWRRAGAPRSVRVP